MSTIYIDSSAFVKAIIAEPESACLRDFLAGERGRYVSSSLLRTEALRAIRYQGPDALRATREGLRRVDLVTIDDGILEAAGLVAPGLLRTLDAIHVATELALGDDLGMVMTYDERMIKASATLGIPTATPR